MQEIFSSFYLALSLIAQLNSDLIEIVLLSLQVSISAVLTALVIGLPLGTLIAMSNFPGRITLIIFTNSMMGMPPVVVGLLVYIALSRSGPFGVFSLLYTPTAMIIAQVILITPIVIALTRQVMEELHNEYQEYFSSLAMGSPACIRTLLWEGRYSLITVCLAGFGRAISEVGAVMIVGGNIDHMTRVMTTAIALETSKGDLELALALGLVLMIIALLVNAIITIIRPDSQMQKKRSAL